MEIERKWLVDELPRDELTGARADRIEQGYLTASDDDTAPEVRLRRRGEHTVLTVKSAGSLTRIEEEIAVDERTFVSLWPLTEGRRIEKVRHLVPCGEATLEVDVFEGELEGLVVAEVEFESEDASAAFEPPPWLGAEVTEDGRYKTRNLAVHGPPAR